MTLFYASVDHLAERAFELRERLGSVQAIDLRLSSGSFCRRCESGRKTQIRWPSNKPVVRKRIEVCWDCWNALVEKHGYRGARDRLHKALWQGVAMPERDLLKNEVYLHGGRGMRQRDAAEQVLLVKLDEWRRLQVVVFPKPRGWKRERWAFTLEAYRLWLHAEIGSYAGAAYYGAEQALRWEHWWTEDIVARWVARGREVIARRATRRPPMIAAYREAA